MIWSFVVVAGTSYCLLLLCLYIKGEATEGLRCAHAVGQGLRSRNVNGEFPIGVYCPIPVPVGANFPRPRPCEGSRGALLPHPRLRSGI